MSPLGLEEGGVPHLGHGFGLRTRHYADALAGRIEAPCLEVIAENFLGRGGRPRAVLEAARRDRPIVVHGVSLSIGSTDPLDLGHLARVKELLGSIDAAWFTDHLCFGSHGGHHGHDLWPLPRTEECLRHVASRVREVQDRLGARIALENPSQYVDFASSDLDWRDFWVALLEEADCHMLLDLNNVVVTAGNFGLDAAAFVRALPPSRVLQFHLSGHSDQGDHLFDDHAGRVPASVWDLHQVALDHLGDRTTIVEWDEAVPEWPLVLAEARRAGAAATALRGAA